MQILPRISAPKFVKATLAVCLGLTLAPSISYSETKLSPALKKAVDSFLEAARETRGSAELENGSRYVIQSHFLKTLLAGQLLTDKERLANFDRVIGEIEAYLQKTPKILKLETPADLEAFKATLTSRFTDLADEMKISKGLKIETPVRLVVSKSMVNDVLGFSKTYRALDRVLIESVNLHFFDLLADPTPTGSLFRMTLKALDPAMKTAQLQQAAAEFERQSNSLSEIAPKLVESGAIKFKLPAEQRFFELMISNYFSKYTFAETANVMKAVIERPDQQTPKDLFKVMVLHAGPQMQKLLQVVARKSGLSEDLRETFKSLEEAGLASPWEKIAPIFRDPPQGYKWVKLDKQARVGSMAEVYRGVVVDKFGRKMKIAARTLKPGIREKVEAEIPRLQNLGRAVDTDPVLRSYDFPLVGPVMKDVMSMTSDEADVEKTNANLEKGSRIYTTTERLKNGTIINFVTPQAMKANHPDVMYSNWVEGEKFEDFVKENPELGLKVAEATGRLWIENAMFNERFFHTDLHQGNLKVRRDGPNTITVALLDFGMVGSLKPEERSLLIRLSLATLRGRDPALIAKYAYELSEKNGNAISLERLIKAAYKYAATNAGHPELLTMDMWLGWSLSQGLKLPRDITAFSRGIGTVDQLVISSGSNVPVADMVKSVAMKHKLELAPDLVRYLSDSVVSRSSQVATKVVDKVRATLPAPRCEALFAP